jgi:energy-coupling factor transport system permease protein
VSIHRQDRLLATTWWSLGLSIAASASLLHDIFWLVALVFATLGLTIAFARADQVRRALVFYVVLSLSVVAIRLVFRVIFNQPDGQPIALDLPLVSFTGLGPNVSILGPVSQGALGAALIDGLRLAGIVLGIGMANTLANPRKLLKSTPAALYEVATAAAVSINLAPQLIQSFQRVRIARRMRGEASGIRQMAAILVPVLEDTIDRSLQLAASMDARGFGRLGGLTKSNRVLFQLLSLLSLTGFAFATYFLLATSNAGWILLLVVGGGLVCLFGALKIAGAGKLRTRYPVQSPTILDWVVVAGAISLFTSMALSQSLESEVLQWLP